MAQVTTGAIQEIYNNRSASDAHPVVQVLEIKRIGAQSSNPAGPPKAERFR